MLYQFYNGRIIIAQTPNGGAITFLLETSVEEFF